MSKLARLGVAVAAAAIAVTTPAAAQYGSEQDSARLDTRFYISPMATYTVYDSDKDFDDDASGMLSIGKVFGRGMNIELTAFMNKARRNDGSVEGEINGYALSFLAFMDRNTSPFYWVVTINKIFAEADGASDKAFNDGIDFGFGYWLGLGRWGFLGEGPALRIEGRYRHESWPNAEANRFASDFALANSSREYSDLVAVVGLSIPIGPDPNPPAEPEPEKPDPIIRVIRATADDDGDGVLNEIDKCPDTAPDTRVDRDGCSLDDDGDGVLNGSDQCPDTPAGTAVMANGCALVNDCRTPQAGEKVDARGCAVQSGIVLEGVNFETASARLTPGARQVLDSVVTALQGSPGLRVEIGGHTDDRGNDDYNRRLSGQRAEAVKSYLVTAGIAADRLTTKAYGKDAPIASNEDAAGRAQNRRVELKVVSQ